MGAGSSRLNYTAIALAAMTTAALAADPNTPVGVNETLRQARDAKPAEVSPVSGTKPADHSPAGIKLPAKTITVDHFEFVGNTLFGADQLAPLLKSYTARPISLVELYEAADAITDFYVRHGYTLASAIVPAQKINQGSVRLEVIEGRVGKVRYEGIKRYRAEDLADYVDLTPGKVYRGDAFEQNLRDLNHLPGLTARAELQPGADYGTSDVVIKGSERTFEGVFFADNAGTPNIGVFRYAGQLTINNPTRTSDQLTLLALRSRESLSFNGDDGLLQYGSIIYSLPTGSAGSRINLSYGYAEFHVAGAFAGVSGRNRNAKLEYTTPLIDSANQQLNFVADINDTRANTDFSGTTFSENKVTVLEVGGNYTRYYSSGAVTQGSLLMGSNFQVYDQTDTASQPFKVDLDLQQQTPLPWRMVLTTRTNAVYSFTPLPETQKFAMGGPTTIRGYAPSEARGDWGYLAQLTLSRNYLVGPITLAPRIFYDAGVVRQHQLSRFPPGSQPPELSLASYGFGTDIAWRKLIFKADYAMPTTSAPVSDGKEDGRFYGTLSVAF